MLSLELPGPWAPSGLGTRGRWGGASPGGQLELYPDGANLPAGWRCSAAADALQGRGEVSLLCITLFNLFSAVECGGLVLSPP